MLIRIFAENVSVLPEYIHITSDIASSLEAFLASGSYSNTFILVDENTERDCLPIIKKSLPEATTLIEIKSGEVNKHLETCKEIWEVLTEANADRKALLINLGGGVITDMGGFCAATYKRGIDFVNIPTTLLSQVDASIGGKLGVDFSGFKNHIGLFQIPNKVFIDSVFLKTLSFKELRSGFAEVIKHTLISDEKAFYGLTEVSIQTIDWNRQIEASLEIKNEIVEADPKENGRRKLLNYGHTIGHAIETYYLDTSKHLRHGEAIAIGMIAEGFLSVRKSGMPEQELETLTSYLVETYKPQPVVKEDIEEITRLALQDKKNIGSKINCVLLNQIGKAEFDIEITSQEILEAIEYYNTQIK